MFGERALHVIMNRGAGDGVILLLWRDCCVDEARLAGGSVLLGRVPEKGLEESSDKMDQPLSWHELPRPTGRVAMFDQER